jgi:hypothetical protein
MAVGGPLNKSSGHRSAVDPLPLSRQLGSRCRSQAILLAALLACAALPGAAAVAAPPPGDARVSFVEAFRRNDDVGSPFVTAVGVRWTPSDIVAAPARVLVLVDTSASQIGDHRRRSRDADRYRYVGGGFHRGSQTATTHAILCEVDGAERAACQQHTVSQSAPPSSKDNQRRKQNWRW